MKAHWIPQINGYRFWKNVWLVVTCGNLLEGFGCQLMDQRQSKNDFGNRGKMESLWRLRTYVVYTFAYSKLVVSVLSTFFILQCYNTVMLYILLSLLSWRCIISPSMDQHLWYIRLSSFFYIQKTLPNITTSVCWSPPKKKISSPKKIHIMIWRGGCGVKMSKMLFLGNASLLE